MIHQLLGKIITYASKEDWFHAETRWSNRDWAIVSLLSGISWFITLVGFQI